jgi:hypothetical protein
LAAKGERAGVWFLYKPIVRQLQARGASEIEPNGSITVHRDTTRFEVEKIANEMFVMEARRKEMIGVEQFRGSSGVAE